jgi:hypothetical protein
VVGENYHEPLAITANDVEVEQIHLSDQIVFFLVVACPLSDCIDFSQANDFPLITG